MQGFIHFVWEIRIVLYTAAKRCPVYQFRIETERPSPRLEDFSRVFDAYNLSRSQTYHWAFPVIVTLSSVNQFTVFLIFQIYRIETECMRMCFIGFAFDKSITLTNGCSVSTPNISLYSVTVLIFNNSLFISMILMQRYGLIDNGMQRVTHKQRFR